MPHWTVDSIPFQFGRLKGATSTCPPACCASVLRQRLTELLDAQLVAQGPDTTYALTELGHGAYLALRPLVRWSGQWASKMAEDGEA